MNGKAQCVFQFLTSILISSGQIVQYLTLIYFYGGGSPLVRLRRRRGERNMAKTSINLTFLLFSTGLVNSSCFYLCQDNMNDIKLYFLKYYCLYVVGTCISLNIKDCCYIFRFLGFSTSCLNLHSIFILYWLDNSSNISVFQQTKVGVTTVVTAYQM